MKNKRGGTIGSMIVTIFAIIAIFLILFSFIFVSSLVKKVDSIQDGKRVYSDSDVGLETMFLYDIALPYYEQSKSKYAEDFYGNA